METRHKKLTKERTLAKLAQLIARGEETINHIISEGHLDDVAVATEFYYILRGIQLGMSKLPPPQDPSDHR
jgi:hypothetical protein